MSRSLDPDLFSVILHRPVLVVGGFRLLILNFVSALDWQEQEKLRQESSLPLKHCAESRKFPFLTRAR
jgi:hypothetical protein